MPVNTTHRQYSANIDDWKMMADALAGERAVKDAGTLYLPKTAAMREASRADSPITQEEADELYRVYKLRATYPLWVKDSLRTMMGLIARQELEIQLPERMKALIEEATTDGFSLHQLWMRVVSGCLTKGRAPLMGDFDDAGLPYIAEYSAEAAINWLEDVRRGRRDLVMAVFEEERVRDDSDEFSPQTEKVYRVLDIANGQARVRLLREDGSPVADDDLLGRSNGAEIEAIDFLPVVYVGSTDNNPDVDEIPLLTMAHNALEYYQLSADLRSSVHNTSHAQPVVTGLDDDQELRITGPQAAWVLPEKASAFYLETSGNGHETTMALMDKARNSAAEVGARVMDQGVESGDARRARQDDQHSTLYGVAKLAASGIEQLCKYIAEWMGANPDEVVVSVEPKFSRQDIGAAMVGIVRDLRLAGEAPAEVLFETLRKAGLTDYTDVQLFSLLEGGDGALTDAE